MLARRCEFIVWLRVRLAEGCGGAGVDALTGDGGSYELVFLRFVPRFAAAPLAPLPLVTWVLIGGRSTPFAAAAAWPARWASSRFVSSWCACERRKRPLAAELAAADAEAR